MSLKINNIQFFQIYGASTKITVSHQPTKFIYLELWK